MKKVNLLTLILGILLFAQTTSAQKGFTKKYHKEFKATKNTTLDINNRYGELHVENWDKNSISIDVIITVKKDKKERAEKIFKKISITFNEGGDIVSALTKINESINNTTLRSRVISLDQGILVVDETADGDGSTMNPTDEQADNFYDELLSHYKRDEYDLFESGNIGIADIGAFSTILWHGNDFQDMQAPFDFKEQIMQYLNFGGNFFYTGYRPGKAFEKASGNPVTFEPSDFIYDYFLSVALFTTFFCIKLSM